MLLRSVITAAALALAGIGAGCSTVQTYATSTFEDGANTLKPGDLQAFGIACITPSTVTGQEEDKQALALVFGKVLAETRPRVRVVALAETLGAINRSGLTEDYRRMFADYRESGIFDRAALQKVGKAAGARYIAQLKMASFSQGSDTRFGALGFRILQTKKANIRLFLQVWDSVDGSIAWQGAQEVHVAEETFSESAVTFRSVVEVSARDLIARLP
jgi:hypothetical protein